MSFLIRYPTPCLLMCRFLVSLLLLAGCTPTTQPTALPLADGRTWTLKQPQDRWLLINYWAIWCAPCRTEIPHLNQLASLQETYQLLVLGVNYDGLEGGELAAQIKQLDIGFPILLRPGQDRLQLPRPAALPATYLYNAELQLVKTWLGPQTEASLLAGLAQLRTQAKQ